MRMHAEIGAAIVLESPGLAAAAALVRASHERWDGAGYPDGLAGEEIPLGARIVAVCDAYSAMRQQRPYGAGAVRRGGPRGAPPLRGHAVRPAGRRRLLRALSARVRAAAIGGVGGIRQLPRLPPHDTRRACASTASTRAGASRRSRSRARSRAG